MLSVPGRGRGAGRYLGGEHRPHLKWAEALHLIDLESFSKVTLGGWGSAFPTKKSQEWNKDGE